VLNSLSRATKSFYSAERSNFIRNNKQNRESHAFHLIFVASKSWLGSKLLTPLNPSKAHVDYPITVTRVINKDALKFLAENETRGNVSVALSAQRATLTHTLINVTLRSNNLLSLFFPLFPSNPRYFAQLRSGVTVPPWISGLAIFATFMQRVRTYSSITSCERRKIKREREGKKRIKYAVLNRPCNLTKAVLSEKPICRRNIRAVWRHLQRDVVSAVADNLLRGPSDTGSSPFTDTGLTALVARRASHVSRHSVALSLFLTRMQGDAPLGTRGSWRPCRIVHPCRSDRGESGPGVLDIAYQAKREKLTSPDNARRRNCIASVFGGLRFLAERASMRIYRALSSGSSIFHLELRSRGREFFLVINVIYSMRELIRW